jgi:nucleotide-binding universal stress UspA family protein
MNAKRPTPNPILCGTDFSVPAKHAADAAAAIALRRGAPLRLVHISEAPASPQVQEQLEAEARRLHEAGVEITAELAEGMVDEVLMRLAHERGAWLVVIASLGRRSPARWLLGSVAERAIESAAVPILVVRDARPFQAWSRGERPLRVFVGTDFTANSDAALRWAGELQAFGQCELTAAYAAWTPEEASRLGTVGELGLVGNPPAVQRILERDIKEKVSRLLGEGDVRIMVQGGWGRADVQLVEMAREAEADIVVVGKHQRQGLARWLEGSVSRGILRYAPMSVACVPTPAGSRMAVPAIHDCQRVLVAVDLNEPHGFAAPYGFGLCHPGGAVHLIHVARPLRLPSVRTGDPGGVIPEKGDYFIQSEARLRALAPDEAVMRGIKTSAEVVEDADPVRAICAAAERINADVICVGSHTRPGLGAKLLGSVALGVLQHCRRPVLVVWPPAI